MRPNKPELIVALDVEKLEDAQRLVKSLSPEVKLFKVGSQLYTACGPKIIDYIKRKRASVFLDLKFYDIPNTVAGAVAAATGHGAFMLTLHVQGGVGMLKAAKKSAVDTARRMGMRRPLLIGVTVLTSKASRGAAREVFSLAKVARQSGIDGVVSSVRECKNLRKRFGKKFIIVTPGIRPKGSAKGDQKRTATVAEAVRCGSNFLVVGRPITGAKNPVSAARKILNEIKSS